MADLTILDDDEALVYARCVLASVFEAEAVKLAAAVRRRMKGGSRRVAYSLRVDFPDTDEKTGMLQPVASSRVSEVSEVRRLLPIRMFGQQEMPLPLGGEDEEG